MISSSLLLFALGAVVVVPLRLGYLHSPNVRMHNAHRIAHFAFHSTRSGSTPSRRIRPAINNSIYAIRKYVSHHVQLKCVLFSTDRSSHESEDTSQWLQHCFAFKIFSCFLIRNELNEATYMWIGWQRHFPDAFLSCSRTPFASVMQHAKVCSRFISRFFLFFIFILFLSFFFWPIFIFIRIRIRVSIQVCVCVCLPTESPRAVFQMQTHIFRADDRRKFLIAHYSTKNVENYTFHSFRFIPFLSITTSLGICNFNFMLNKYICLSLTIVSTSTRQQKRKKCTRIIFTVLRLESQRWA